MTKPAISIDESETMSHCAVIFKAGWAGAMRNLVRFYVFDNQQELTVCRQLVEKGYLDEVDMCVFTLTPQFDLETAERYDMHSSWVRRQVLKLAKFISRNT